ncbi:MAG: ribonuclease HIII [Verrucomicrobiota bacterium]
MPTTSHTAPLTPDQAEALRTLLDQLGFEFKEKPYTLFAASKDKLSIAVYEKGPKVLIQGKATEDFIINHLEPEILGEAKLGYEEVHHPDWFSPHFGIDESGKGDFFGPLVTAGVYTDEAITRTLMDLGVTDSKRITSDKRITDLAEQIEGIPGIAVDVVQINPLKYNDLYESFLNLNKLLAWAHARCIANLAAKKPNCPRTLSDQFGNPRLIEHALSKHDIPPLELQQRTKAESDPAVAAASIIARHRFITALKTLAQEAGLESPLPRGAGPKTQEFMRDLAHSHGKNALRPLAKMHFKFTETVL